MYKLLFLGKKLLFCLNKDIVNLKGMEQALFYFSEISPLGVVGSYMLDRLETKNEYMTFKHHYITHALDSEIVFLLLKAMHGKYKVRLVNAKAKHNGNFQIIATPLKILISVQSGRRYICVKTSDEKIKNFRIDCIKQVILLHPDENFDELRDMVDNMLKNTWGCSFGNQKTLEHLQMSLRIELGEEYIIKRIAREGRQGTLTKLADSVYQYDIKVYDTTEMIPWLRTFIGRIILLKCSNRQMENLNQLVSHLNNIISYKDELLANLSRENKNLKDESTFKSRLNIFITYY